MAKFILPNCTCFVCCLGIQWAINHACQSGDVSVESVMSSAGLTCVLFLMRLRVFLYFSMFLCVCVLWSGGAEGPGNFLLYLWQESFVPLGIRCPLLCLLSKPVTRMKYKYNYLAKLNKVCLHVWKTNLLPMSKKGLEHVLTVIFFYCK